MPVELWLPPKPAIIRPAPNKSMLTFPVTLYSGTAASRSIQGTNTVTSAGATTLSAGSLALGTAVGTSLVVVAISGAAGAGIAGTAITSVSIDGTNGTLDANVTFGADTTVKVWSVVASRATSNTSGTISVTASQNITNAFFQVYRLINLTSATKDDTKTNSGDGLASVSTSNTIVGPGIAIAAACTLGTTANNASFSAGVTTDFQNTVNNRHGADGSAQNLGSGSLTITAIPPSGIATTRMCIAAANWH